MPVADTPQGRRVLPALTPMIPYVEVCDCERRLREASAASLARRHRLMACPETRERLVAKRSAAWHRRMSDPAVREAYNARRRDYLRRRRLDPDFCEYTRKRKAEWRAANRNKGRVKQPDPPPSSGPRKGREIRDPATEAHMAQQRAYHWANREARLEIMRRWRARQKEKAALDAAGR